MKKLLMLLILMTLGWGVKAQCPLHTAIDFTATDCHGTEVHLFDILDHGQYVLIDFFFYNCSGCNITVPMMVQSYQAFGCNMHDVYYMEISDRDSDTMCQNWVANYGVEYPTISGLAGGSSIVDQYMIGSFPCVILIAPDHSIVINDLWPIDNVQDIIHALENQGIQQHVCSTDINEPSPFVLNLYPNPANENVTLKSENLGTISVYNALGQKLNEFLTKGDELNINTANYENGVYFVKANETTLRFVVTH